MSASPRRPLPPYYGPPADPEATRRSPAGAGRRRRLTGLERVAVVAAGVADRVRPWHRQPMVLGLASLMALRIRLARYHLHDTRVILGPLAPPEDTTPRRDVPPGARGADGTGGDATYARAGRAGGPFGRNIPPSADVPEEAVLADPTPRRVSRALLARRRRGDGLEPQIRVPTLNLLAAAWIQFMVHDWVGHGGAARPYHEVPLEPDDAPGAPGGWAGGTAGGEDGSRMLVGRTPPWRFEDPRTGQLSDPVRHACGLPAFQNVEAHWWDGSQIYGSTAARQAQLRSGRGGELLIGEDGRLLREADRPGADGVEPWRELTGMNQNSWVGLSLLHALLVAEHNRVCRMLRTWYPAQAGDDEWLFGTARLIVSAVMAKIHTVEWTPAIVAHPTAAHALRANWSGILGPRLGRRVPRALRGRYLTGIPGSRREDWGVPHAMTEEFVAIYRMHALLPDEVRLREIPAPGAAPGEGEPVALADLVEPRHREVIEGRRLDDLLYSLGLDHPSALLLHNYPETLRALEHHPAPPRTGVPLPGVDLVTEPGLIDLATIDVLRDRERGIPRYLAFRRGLGLRPVTGFDGITGADRADPDGTRAALAAELAAEYRDPEDVDLMVGLYAEPLLPGFGFSETAFALFSLMASRRLMCDRFLTDDYGPELYTPAGIAWIESASMAGLIGAHHPRLALLMPRVRNAFAPWDAPANLRGAA